MDVGEGLAGVRAPVPQQARLNVFDLQRLAEQGVILEVKHSQREVEAGTPVSVYLAQLLRAQRSTLDRRASRTVRRDRYFRGLIENFSLRIFTHTLPSPAIR
jgi:hypothetical protein